MKVLIFLTVVAIITIIILMFLLTKFSRVNTQVSRFILTGGLNTSNYYLAYLLLISKWEYMYAHLSAFILSAFISYFVSTIYTFDQCLSFKKFILFPLTFLPNLIISSAVTYFFVNYQIINQTFASLIAMILAIPITFVVTKLIITGKTIRN